MSDHTIRLDLESNENTSSLTIQEYADGCVKRFLDRAILSGVGSCVVTKHLYEAIKGIYESDEREHGILVALALLNLGAIHAKGADVMIADIIDQIETDLPDLMDDSHEHN